MTKSPYEPGRSFISRCRTPASGKLFLLVHGPPRRRRRADDLFDYGRLRDGRPNVRRACSCRARDGYGRKLRRNRFRADGTAAKLPRLKNPRPSSASAVRHARLSLSNTTGIPTAVAASFGRSSTTRRKGTIVLREHDGHGGPPRRVEYCSRETRTPRLETTRLSGRPSDMAGRYRPLAFNGFKPGPVATADVRALSKCFNFFLNFFASVKTVCF